MKSLPGRPGSYKKPYVRRDDVEMTKWSAHVPVAFVARLKMFIAYAGLNESASSFVVRAVDERMTQEIARRKQSGQPTSIEDAFDVGPKQVVDHEAMAAERRAVLRRQLTAARAEVVRLEHELAEPPLAVRLIAKDDDDDARER